MMYSSSCAAIRRGLLLFLSFCLISGDIFAETLTVGGTGSALEALRRLGSAYARIDRNFTLSVLSSLGSRGAVKGLASKSLDLGVMARPLLDDEMSFGLVVEPLARTPLVMATNRRTEENISTNRLEEIYSGRVQHWSDGSQIRLVLRPPSETDNQILASLSPGMKSAIAAAAQMRGMVTAVTDQEAADFLESLPGSLGITSLGQITAEGRPLHVLPLNGVAAAFKGMVNPAYPVMKSLYLVSRNDATPLARRFVAFVRSAEGRAILAKLGYLDGPE